MPLPVSVEVKEEGGSWVVTETAVLQGTTISDVSTLEKGTLVLKHRSIKQGPVAIELDIKDGKATGTMTMSGQTKPISVDLGGALFADGAGSHNVIAALPLAPGYTTTFRNFDVQRQQVQLKQLKVVGAESVTVPAGTFDAHKLELTDADGSGSTTTIWIAKDTRKVVKVSATLPQMGGAVITTELEK